MEAAFQVLLEYGALGAVLIIMIIMMIHKDRQVNALYVRLVEKSERDSEKYHELSSAQSDMLRELAEEVQELHKVLAAEEVQELHKVLSELVQELVEEIQELQKHKIPMVDIHKMLLELMEEIQKRNSKGIR